MTKFARQIQVLKELQGGIILYYIILYYTILYYTIYYTMKELMEPLPPMSELDPRFRCAHLAETKPSRVFK